MTAVYKDPPHPGEFIQDALEELGMSARQFASHIGVAPASITRLINKKGPMTPEMAVRVHAALGGPSVEMWLRIQASYDACHITDKVDVSHITRLYEPSLTCRVE